MFLINGNGIVQELLQLEGLVIAFDLKVEESIYREHANLLTDKERTVVNRHVLCSYRESLLRLIKSSDLCSKIILYNTDSVYLIDEINTLTRIIIEKLKF